MLGHEELLADSFGDAWADPEFWQALADKNLGIARRALLKFKMFLGRIVSALKTEQSTPATQHLFTYFAAIKRLVLETSAKYAEMGKTF